MLTGRCSSYGRDITYKPLAEMLGSYPGGWPALARQLDGADPTGRRAARHLTGIMAKQAETGEQVSTEEISWAIRCLLTMLGRTHAVVLVWEDLQWAEATLLDLVDDLATWLTDAPVLMLCVARNELIEARPSWGGGKLGATTIELGPLSHAQSAQLVSELAGQAEVLAHQHDALCERVALECEGNPLFAELMLDVFAEAEPSAGVPPTIAALLTARLDQLSGQERQLTELASAIGRDFSWDVLRPMVNADGIGDQAADELITQLVRRRIIQRASPGAFRFGQALLRDAAYALAPKARREHWHLFLADWLGGRLRPDGDPAADPMAFACHVESACQLGRELRPERPARAAGRAAQVLITEGMKALHRKDLPSAAKLLERGRSLLPGDDPARTQLALYICDCWLGLSDQDRALLALVTEDEVLRASWRHQIVCRIQRGTIRVRLGLTTPEEVAAEAAGTAAELASHPADDLAWCRQFQLQAYLSLDRGQNGRAEAELRQALGHAQAMQDKYEEERILGGICELSQWTPTPVSVGLALCAELTERFAASRTLLVPVLLTKARLSALADDLPSAHAALAAVQAFASDLHLDLADAAAVAVSGLVASLAGQHAAAEADYRRSQALLLTFGLPSPARTQQAYAARELFEQGEVQRAAQAVKQLTADQAAAAPDDLRTRVLISALTARILSIRGEHDRALCLARETAAAVEGTDELCLNGDTQLDLAIVAHRAGQAAEASAAVAAALDRYRARGATRLIARAERWQAELAGAGTGGQG